MLKYLKKLKEKGIVSLASLLIFHLRWFFYLKFKYFSKVLEKTSNRKRIMFYPKKPDKRFAIYKICHFLGCSMTDKTEEKYDLAINLGLSVPEKISKETKTLNINCVDITKRNVESVFANAFGYKLSINPLTFKGKCVKKPNQNASGIGTIIQCPISKIDKNYSYQKIINSETNSGKLLNMRVPILDKNIPFVYLRFKKKEELLNDTTSKGVKIKKATDVFSKEERKKIISFCEKIGMDYGELDILRDKADKKIYIIDANNTPFGPHYLPKKETEKALNLLSNAFEKEFLSK